MDDGPRSAHDAFVIGQIFLIDGWQYPRTF
jgi:hypothetical protein